MQTGKVTDDEFIQALDAEVQRINEEDRKRGGHMISGEKVRAAENKAHHDKGKAEGKAEMIVNMYKQGISLEVIAVTAEKTVEEIQAILDEQLATV